MELISFQYREWVRATLQYNGSHARACDHKNCRQHLAPPFEGRPEATASFLLPL